MIQLSDRAPNPESERNYFLKLLLPVGEKYAPIFFFCDLSLKKIISVSKSIEHLNKSPDLLFQKEWPFWESLVHPQDHKRLNLVKQIFSINGWRRDVNNERPSTANAYFRIKFFGTWIWVILDLEILSYQTNWGIDKLCGSLRQATLHRPNKTIVVERNFSYEQSSRSSLLWNVTLREKEVLELVADGLSSKEIADKLHISTYTAINHRKNLISKFKVKNTAQLIKEASRAYKF